MNDAAELPKLQQQVEQAFTEFNGMLAVVREHQASIEKGATALADLREQFIRMRASLREWERSLWHMRWRDAISRDASRAAERQARTLGSLVDEVIWETFDFRKRPAEGAKP